MNGDASTSEQNGHAAPVTWKESRDQVKRAAEWLAEKLADGQPRPSLAIQAEAKAAGFTKSSLLKARETVGVKTYCPHWGQPWLWRLKRRRASAPDKPDRRAELLERRATLEQELDRVDVALTALAAAEPGGAELPYCAVPGCLYRQQPIPGRPAMIKAVRVGDGFRNVYACSPAHAGAIQRGNFERPQ